MLHRNHGLSHMLGYLIVSLVSGIIVDILRRHVPLFNSVVTSIAYRLSVVLDYKVTPKVLSVTLIACLLAFAWGVAYRLRYGR